MKYYYLNGKDQIGPLSRDEIHALNLSPDTLVFKEGQSSWLRLGEISELIKNTEIKEDLNNSEQTLGLPNPIVIAPVKNRRLTRLIFWISFNLFALVMSYSGVELFNNGGYQTTEVFWPFVQFIGHDEYFDPTADGYTPNIMTGERAKGKWVEKKYFYGLFTEYDWSEFLVYSGIGLLVFFFIKKPKVTN